MILIILDIENYFIIITLYRMLNYILIVYGIDTILTIYILLMNICSLTK